MKIIKSDINILQAICKKYGYEVFQTIRPQEFEFEARRPFAKMREDYTLEIAAKYLNGN